ncbi:polyprenyl synthetase family protein [Ideonella sp. A 288]|uniref:polyprenyl synthetase family protein n=1 Tax=Ideonella sp. A 288 TaxID=1962181 RepID=UPI000B4AF64D|nr:polyprenyl synthetase family protein [Ideonella sp. A 288]
MAVLAADPPRVDDVLIRDVLEDYATQVRAGVDAWLAGVDESPYLGPLLADYPRRGGKMLRATLCLAAAHARGAAAGAAMPTAVAIELLHNALLVHDDIEDGSEQRRGIPTLHELHGVPLALNAGTALMLHAHGPLWSNSERLGGRLALRVVEEFHRMGLHAVEGQALELGWQRDNRTTVDERDYLEMVRLKTCWQTTIHPLRVGVLIGSQGADALDPFDLVGFFLGAAFQIQDDLLNLEGGPDYGKEIDGDLREGKRTLMVVHALRHAAAAERGRLVEFLGLARADRSDGDVDWVRTLMDRTGALDAARTTARALAGAALSEFDRCTAHWPDSRDRRFLRQLVLWVVRRTH